MVPQFDPLLGVRDDIGRRGSKWYQSFLFDFYAPYRPILHLLVTIHTFSSRVYKATSFRPSLIAMLHMHARLERGRQTDRVMAIGRLIISYLIRCVLRHVFWYAICRAYYRVSHNLLIINLSLGIRQWGHTQVTPYGWTDGHPSSKAQVVTRLIRG